MTCSENLEQSGYGVHVWFIWYFGPKCDSVSTLVSDVSDDVLVGESDLYWVVRYRNGVLENSFHDQFLPLSVVM